MAKSSFGGTVKLTGESEYRNALKNITSELKLMSQQMIAVTNNYSDNGDDINALTEKDRILNKELDLQTSKLITLNGMLDQAKTKYGEDSSQVNILKEKVNLAHLELDKMNKNLDKNTDALNKAKQSQQEFDDENKTSINSMKDFTAELLKSMAGASNLGQTIKDDLTVRVNDLKGNITTSKEKVKNFAETVADTVKHPENLGKALKEKLIDTADKLQSSAKDDADAIEEIGESAEKSGEKSLKLGDIIKANLISEAIIGGIKALGNAVKGVATAFNEWADMANALQEQERKVQTVLNNTTDATEEQIQAYIDLTAQKEKNGVISQEAILSGAQELSTYVEEIDTLETLTDTMLDMTAQQYGINASMEQTTNIATTLGKALANGDYSGLTRLGYGFDEVQMKIMKTGTEAERAQVIMDVVGASVGGMNEALALTNAGKVQIATSYIDDMKKSVGALFSDIKDGFIADFLPEIQNVTDAIQGMVSGDLGIEEGMEQITAGLQSGIEKITEKLPEILKVGMDILTKLIDGIVSALPTLMPAVIQVINTLVQNIIQLLPQILQAGIEIIVELANGLAQALPDLIPVAIDTIVLLVETLLDNIDQIIDAGINLILGLADGLMEALPRLIEKIPVIIEKLIDAITNNLPKIIEMGIKLTLDLAVGLIKAIPQLVSKIPQIITALVKGLGEGVGKIAEVGLNLVKGLWNGINNAKDWVLDKIKGFGKSILNGIKSFFGIHSPSTLFRDEVGSNLALGIGEGFSDTMSNVTEDMVNAIPTEFDTNVNSNINTLSSATSYSYDVMVEAFKQALTEVKVVMNEREMGTFITDTVEEVVYS